MYGQTIKRISYLLFAALLLALAGTAAPTLAKTEAVPVSHFITPYEGDLVSGVVYVEVFMFQGHGQPVEFGVDGSQWQGMLYIGDGRYANYWNSYEAEEGEHALTARFADESAGELVIPARATVTVYHEMPPGPTESGAQVRPALFGRGLDPAADQNYNMMILALGEMQAIPARAITIQFGRVLEDSRPPAGSDSPWPGVVEIQLRVWTDVTPNPDLINLRLDPENPEAATVRLNNGVTLTLRWVSPNPGTDPHFPETVTIGLEYTLN